MVERVEPKLKPIIEDRVKSVPKPVTGTDTVVVGCKLPNGLLMRTFKMVRKRRVISGAVVEEDMAEESARHTVRGPAVPFGMIPNIQIVGGYALTPGVPRDLCELYFEQNKDAPYVENKLVFWEPDMDRAQAHARELRNVRSGLEPLDPSKGVPGVTGIAKANLNDTDMGIG